MVVTNK